MAHISTENLIHSDSSTSTDELNSESNSHSVEKVSKKIFHKKKRTAFVGNSVTSPMSSVTSSPQQHPIIVVGKADVHQPRLSPPKPFPRKHLIETVFQEPVVAKNKMLSKVDEILTISVSGESESSKSEDKLTMANRAEIELTVLTGIGSPSESSGAHSDKTEEPKMFFARSRKNTIVTNIDEISVKSSSRTNKSSLHRSNDETKSYSKPLPKPRKHNQPLFENVHEKQLENGNDNLALKQSITSQSDQSILSDSGSETLSTDGITESEVKEIAEEKTTTDGVRNNPIANNYQNENIIGIYVHSSSELKYDYNVHRPIVRCSVIDILTGQFLRGSKTRSVERNKESDLGNEIQPIMSKGCRFISSNKFQCQWEELLIINENIAHIMHGNEILFFEILDSQSTESKNMFGKFAENTHGWHYVCWGFLKPGDGINYSNVDKRSCLQLYYYQRRNWFRKYSLNVYQQFQLDRIKYPATLSVTVKAIKSVINKPEQDFVKEINGLEWSSFPDKTFSESQRAIKSENIENVTTNHSTFLRRLPGQICKYPNIIHKTHLESSSKGCLVSKFSPNGQFLAYSSSADYNIQIANVPDLKVINTLRGHTNFVYDLDWLVDKGKNSFPLHLLSASSDRTAVVWTIEKDRILLKILPHPSFLYAAKFLANLTDDECVFIVTGGRDCAIRVWKTTDDFDLLQESVEHQNYITSIACATQSTSFYSSGMDGYIFEWCNKERINNYQVTRKFPQLMDGILSIQLHPKNEMRLYAQQKNNLINCLDLSSQIILNTLGTMNDDQNKKSKFSISPCGSTIYTIQWDTILMYNILNGTLQSSFKLPYVKHQKSYISHLDYHPKLFILSASIYGVNGGVVLLSHNSCFTDNHNDVVQHDRSDDRWMLLRDQVHSQSSDLLGNIIQRIDEILQQPQQKNETDDLKKKYIADMKRSEKRFDCDHETGVNIATHVDSLQRLSESDSDSKCSVKSSGTFTIQKQSSSEASNRTFTLTKNAGFFTAKKEVNDGTYSIEVDNNSDDTTISESM